MSEIFAGEETDAVLLVDAANAFNSINRKVMLHNIKFICPAMAVYTYNCYSTASRLFVQGGKEISSAEGTTQGDPKAMPLYAVAIAPLLQMIKSGNAQDVRHIAFADDLCGAGKLVQLRSWWADIVVHGAYLGYYPRADKSWLIVKPHLEETAEKNLCWNRCSHFNRHKYLGGYIGWKEGKAEYVRSLVTRRCDHIHVLCLGSATASLTTYARSQDLSRHERELLSVPTPLGGLGIPIFSNTTTHSVRTWGLHPRSAP